MPAPRPKPTGTMFPHPGQQAEDKRINQYCIDAISDLEAILQNKEDFGEPRIQALARKWWQNFLTGQKNIDMRIVGRRMEHVYIALTRHMATRRTPAPEDNREELEDRFRFKQLVMAFVEDLIFDWHPWATKQVKNGLKQAIARGKNVPQTFENAELSLDRLEDTILPQGDNRRSGRVPIPKRKPVPAPCPPGFEIDAQGVQRPKRKPVPQPQPSPAPVPGAFPRTADDPVPPPCPTPPPAVLNGQPNPAVAKPGPPMGMGYNGGAPPTPPETVQSGQSGAGFQSGMELMQMGMGRGAPS